MAHRALCVFGQLEAAADALHHLLFLASSGEAAAATAAASTLAHEPANQSLQAQAPAPIRPHSQFFRPPITAEPPEGSIPDSYENATAGASASTAQTRSGGRTELNRQQFSGVANMLDSSHAASQPATQEHTGAITISQHPLQNVSPTPTLTQPHETPPPAAPTSDQQMFHQLTHGQQAYGQQDKSQMPRQGGSNQPHGSPAQLGQATAVQEPQHSRETSRHAELPHYQLKLVREACHTVMTLAEKKGQPAFMLPLLESMQQVGSSPALQQVGSSPAFKRPIIISICRACSSPSFRV